MDFNLVVVDPNLLAAARDLCADAGDDNPEYVRGCAELIIEVSVGLSQDDAKAGLIQFLGAPTVNLNDPLTDDQRRAMFAAYSEVFGRTTKSDQRKAFTRLALGLASDDDVSWSRHSPGSLTVAEASRVLAVLDTLSP